MARNSRLPHPPGARFVIAHDWIIKAVGKNAALIVGELDFLDRAQERAGTPLTTRAGLISVLQGLVGRNAIDAGIRTLVEIGWVILIERSTVGSNIRTWHEYALDVKAVEAWLKNQETRRPGTGKPGVPELEPELEPERGAPIKEKEETKKEAENKSATSSPAAASVSKNSTQPPSPGGEGAVEAVEAERWITSLMAAGARKKDANHQLDRAKCQKLRELIDERGFEAVKLAAGDQRYPSGALNACKEAGLLGERRAEGGGRQRPVLADDFKVDPAIADAGAKTYKLRHGRGAHGAAA